MGTTAVNGPADVYPIDLPTALRLANAENLQIAVAREQICQAWAQLDRAGAVAPFPPCGNELRQA